MDTCFICKDPHMSPTSVPGDPPRTHEENSDIMWIICQLLRVRSEDVFKTQAIDYLPFCPACTSGVMHLINLRHKLVQLETDMIKRIGELQIKIVDTIDENERDAFQEDCKEKEAQSIFRKQSLEEYEAKELLRRKILELRGESRDRVDREFYGLEAENIIEIEPSFVQHHLFMSRFGSARHQKSATNYLPPPPLHSRSCKRSRHRHSVESASSKRKVKDEDERLDDEEEEKETTDDWIENQNGPLTRLRLSSALPKVKEEPSEEAVERNSLTIRGSKQISGEGEYSDFQDGFSSNENDERGEDSDFQADPDDNEEDSDFDMLAQRTTRSSRARVQQESRAGQKVKNRNKTKPTPRRWPAEEFNEIQTNEHGRSFYEGIEIECRSGDTYRGAFILKCGSCSKEIDKRSSVSQQRSAYRMMQVHIKAVHLKAYKCTECGKCLRDQRMLHQHMERRHPPGGKRACAPRVFGNDKIPPEVAVHEGGLVEFQGFEIRRIDLENGDYNVECGVCGKLINKDLARRSKQCPYRQMVNHIKGIHLHSYRCQFCQKIFRNSKTLTNHISNQHSETPQDSRSCETCGRPISGNRYLRMHMWSHKNEEEKEAALAAGEKGPETYAEIMEKRKALGPAFQCSECGKTFHFGANLRRHEHVHKKDIKEHQCTQCGKFYCTAESLNSHIKYIHETERVHKKYRCNFCPKWFVTKSPWVKHERTHTKAIPFNCPTCNKGFALKQSMMTHIRNKKCNIKQQRHLSTPSAAPPRKRKKKEPKEVETSRRDGSSRPSQNQDNTNTSPTTPSFHTLQQLPFCMGAPLPAHQNNIASGGPFSFPTTYPRPFDPNYLQQSHYETYM